MYVNAGLDKMAARFKASPGRAVLESTTGHDRMLDDPARTVEILLAAAG